MKHIINKTLFSIFVSLFLAAELPASEFIPLEHFSCRSNSVNFEISPDGKHMLIANVMKENVCDI